MDTLYTLLRSVDNSRTPPFTAQDAAELLQRKRAYLNEEAKGNPLLREILLSGSVACEFVPKTGHRSFLNGPATFFRTHELLRQTRKKNLPLQIGGAEFSHNDVVDLYERCVPNVRLRHAPWCSLSRYTTSVGLAWTSTLLVSHIVARSGNDESVLDRGVLYYMGLYTTLMALLYTAFKTNRDVRQSAPWNTALYLDLNVDLVRRDAPAAAAACKDVLPRQPGLFKTPDFYQGLARRIESHGFDAELQARLGGQAPAAPSGPRV